MADHLHATSLYHGSTVSIRDVRCRPARADCGGEEQSDAPVLVFPRSGMFLKHLGGRHFVADCNQVLFFNAGEPYRVSHPVPGGDDCTVFAFAPPVLLDALARYQPGLRERPDRPFAFSHARNEPNTLLFQHRLRQRFRGQEVPGLEVEEVSLALLGAVVAGAYRAAGQRPVRAAPATARAHRERAEAAKCYLARRFREPVTLAEIARAVRTSPYHLTRLFRRETGVPLHRYLNRLRLGHALERLADGASNLTDLALDLGYSSHSHFSDAFRRAFGTTPSAFRRTTSLVRLRQMSKDLKA